MLKTMETRNLMLGNVFMRSVGDKLIPYEVISVETETKSGVVVTFKSLKSDYESIKLKPSELDGNAMRSIKLNDDFFKNLDYEISSEVDTGSGIFISHIIAGDAYGPAITKIRKADSEGVQYALTGLILETADDFQTLMRYCRCENIADSVNVYFKTKFVE